MTSRLLYPVAQKNYTDDPFVDTAWKELHRYLEHAYMLTVFGYRAPDTDVEAVALMKQAWGDADSRELEQVEIIDIRSPQELYDAWKRFICRQHYSLQDDFYSSYSALHARRSCEDFWEAAMQNNPQAKRPIPKTANWDELAAWFEPLLEQERNQGETASAEERQGR